MFRESPGARGRDREPDVLSAPASQTARATRDRDNSERQQRSLEPRARDRRAAIKRELHACTERQKPQGDPGETEVEKRRRETQKQETWEHTETDRDTHAARDSEQVRRGLTEIVEEIERERER